MAAALEMGINIPPPFFCGFLYFWATMAVFFSVFFVVIFIILFAILETFLAWRFPWWRAGRVEIPAAALVPSLLMSFRDAAVFRWKARKLDLPSWADYPSETDAPPVY